MTNLEALTHIFNTGNPLPTEMSVVCLAEKPCLVLGLTWPDEWRDFDHVVAWRMTQTHRDQFADERYIPSFRCTDIQRLPYILAHGCDVVPTDAVFWVDKFPGKALEYGGEAKVMMVFDAKKLRNSGREVRADIAPEELDSLRAVYPTLLKASDGQHLWLSRLPESSRQIGGAYEVEYGRWIPGDPWEALKMLIVLTHEMSLLPNLLGTSAAEKSK